MTITLKANPWVVPTIKFGGTDVAEQSFLVLLGCIMDSRLAYSQHVRSIEVRGYQRLGFLRRACRVLQSTHAREVAYKAFVRPFLEYAPLVWMGSHSVSKLEMVQKRAMRAIGGTCYLDSLHHRRKVAALTYLYKLRCGSVPKRLSDMVPPPLPKPLPASLATRGSILAVNAWHPVHLKNPLAANALEVTRRSFPYCIISDWNRLPPELFDGTFQLSKLQKFKTSVHRFLRTTNHPCIAVQ